MTRQDVVDLVNEKLEVSNNLSRDDLYEIGLAHRKLPKVERSWEWLNSIVGYKFVSSEAYRNFVLKKVRKEDSGELNQITSQEDKLNETKQEIYKERQKLRDERTALNALLRDAARVERFKEELQAQALKLKSLPTIHYTHSKTGSKIEAVALLSDLHLGMFIDEYCNKYNIEIAMKRLDKWVEDVIRYCRAKCVKRLNVINLGDLIAGDIHPSIRIMQEIDVAVLVNLLYVTIQIHLIHELVIIEQQ